MKLESILKVITICITILLVTASSSTVFADYVAAPSTGGGSSGAISSMGGVSSGGGSVGDFMNNLLGLVQALAGAVAAIMLIAVGIKYVMSAPDEKANVKKHAIVYFIGALLVFGGITIVRFMAGIAESW